MNPLKVFTTPQYLFHPSQVLVRLQRALSKRPHERELVKLPWGASLIVHPNEAAGSSIWYYGLTDLNVAEAISRLLDPSEVALDIGANIGQMTSLMRVLTGPTGRVLSFEPHPQVFADLSENTRRFTYPSFAPVEVHEVALSGHEGVAVLDQGTHWNSNRGLARVVLDGSAQNAGSFKVGLRALDNVLPEEVQIGVCKIDVEGHEIHVLRGAERLLRRRQIRDIVFEDFGTYPSDVQRTLLEHGFTLFSLHLSLFKLELRPLTSQPTFRRPMEGCDFVATLDPERAQKRFDALGWTVFKKRC